MVLRASYVPQELTYRIMDMVTHPLLIVSTHVQYQKLNPGWKGLRVSGAVCKYSREIHDIHAQNHKEITRNAHPCAHDDSALRVHLQV